VTVCLRLAGIAEIVLAADGIRDLAFAVEAGADLVVNPRKGGGKRCRVKCKKTLKKRMDSLHS
jgi:hypothetical protein